MNQAPHLIVSPFRAATYDTLVGLLAATGLRIGEAITLDHGDIDWARACCASGRRSSAVPPGPPGPQRRAGAHRLRRPPQANSRRIPRRRPSSSPGPAIACLRRRFPDVPAAGDRAGVGTDAPTPPRLHDLRHSFAVRTLLTWYRTGRGRPSEDPLPVHLSRAPGTILDLLVPIRCPGTARAGRCPPRHGMVGGPVMTLIAPTLQSFFTDRLAHQRQASPRTISAYRDTLRFLLTFVHQPKRQAAIRNSTGTTWTPRRSPRS